MLHHGCVFLTGPKLFLIAALLICVSNRVSPAQATGPHIDSDGDGLSDDLEQDLLTQFAPVFMVAKDDCAGVPGEFRFGVSRPTLKTENGTIYGQVFPAKTSTEEQPEVEIHYYHLWKQDCGAHGHPLDAEHVSVLVRSAGGKPSSAKWKAIYWYAAAHEDTVCDVSQIARASTLHAEDHGARVWISAGKHASYLNEILCQRGCGADKCQDMVVLPPGKLVNLGELGHPMNDSLFVSSSLWPLASKMATANFPDAVIARLNQLPETDIAWFNPGRHPAQGVIAVSGTTENAIASSGYDTSTAISVAEDSTGNALQKSYRNTKHALGESARHVGEALHLTPKSNTPD